MFAVVLVNETVYLYHKNKKNMDFFFFHMDAIEVADSFINSNAIK